MRRLFYSVIFLCAFLSYHRIGLSQSFNLVKDINVGSVGQCLAPTPQPLNLTELGGSLYFTATFAGPALWKSDGTSAGTMRFKELSNLSGLTLVKANNILFLFGRNDNTSDQELWKSDGTEAGTVLVNSWAGNYISGDIISSNGLVYFHLGNTSELWRSDGTTVGTTTIGSFPGVTNMIDVNGILFFSANGQLWKSDGTTAGTILVKNVGLAAYPNTIAVGSTLFFVGFDNVNGYELWKSDGTEAGTAVIKDIEPGVDASNIRNLGASNNVVYFFATTTANSVCLWKSDGSTAGTVLVKDLNDSDPYSSLASNKLTNVNGTIFFAGFDDDHGRELWKTDGTDAGTVMVKDIFPGTDPSAPTSLINFNGTLYFSASNAIFSFEFGATDCNPNGELWKSDGTEAGTVLVKDIYQGIGGSGPLGFVPVNGTLFFRANNGINGRELWKTNGTENGTALVKDIFASPGSSPRWFTELNGKVYFDALNGDQGPSYAKGRDIYQTDGTVSGTGQSTQENPFGGYPRELISHNGALYISANNGCGYELYKSNGLGLPGSNTVLVKKINNPASNCGPGSNPSHFTSVGQSLFFSVTDGTNGYELWKTDGTAAGTVIVKNINPGGDSNPNNLINVNGTLYFTADNGTDGIELWKSDGTDAGTVLVKNINPVTSSNPAYLTAINGILYFAADDGANGIELWKTDGTETGTVLVKNINVPGSSNPASLTNINGVLYFSADDGSTGVEVWRSDGSNAGTILLKDIYAGAVGSNPTLFTNFNGTVLFAADNGIAGRELWGSNGTVSGTVLVKDILPGASSSNPTVLKKIGNNILFAANDGVHGNEVWQSNGTELGTRLVGEIQLGAAGSDPTEFFEYGPNVLVAATNELSGSEVWISLIPTGSALPLELLEFKGAVVNSDGILNWKTENENNTSSFIIERSLNGRDYSSVGSVSAANSPNAHYYDFTDVNIAALGVTTIYYRLKQTDIDGKYTYSNIVVLSIGDKKSIVLLYPNPAKDKLNMTFTVAQREKLQWQLTDYTGRTVKSGMYNLTAGSTTASIDIANLGSGIYLLQLKGTTLQKMIKVVKQ